MNLYEVILDTHPKTDRNDYVVLASSRKKSVERVIDDVTRAGVEPALQEALVKPVLDPDMSVTGHPIHLRQMQSWGTSEGVVRRQNPANLRAIPIPVCDARNDIIKHATHCAELSFKIGETPPSILTQVADDASGFWRNLMDARTALETSALMMMHQVTPALEALNRAAPSNLPGAAEVSREFDRMLGLAKNFCTAYHQRVAAMPDRPRPLDLSVAEQVHDTYFSRQENQVTRPRGFAR